MSLESAAHLTPSLNPLILQDLSSLFTLSELCNFQVFCIVGQNPLPLLEAWTLPTQSQRLMSPRILHSTPFILSILALWSFYFSSFPSLASPHSSSRQPSSSERGQRSSLDSQVFFWRFTSRSFVFLWQQSMVSTSLVRGLNKSILLQPHNICSFTTG